MNVGPKISVVSPVYGCKDCLRKLYQLVASTFDAESIAWEIILVDDRGPDTPWSLIEELASEDSRVTGVRLAKNHGQHLAIWAGFAKARGDWVAVIDCDLQDDPSIIPELLTKAVETGSDAVVVERGLWKDSGLRRTLSSQFYKMLNRLFDLNFDQNTGNFGIYSRRLVDLLLTFRDKEVFLPIMVALTGLPKVTHRHDRASRDIGESSYNFFRLLRLAVSIIIRFTDRPLKYSIYAGLLISAFSAVVSVCLLFLWMIGAFSVPGWTSVILSTWFLSGLILAVLGVHGFYVGRIFSEVQDRPRIIVEQVTKTTEGCRLKEKSNAG